jgi:type I restriction-modification system DNA methylase subunit
MCPMIPSRLPSLDVPENEKRGYTEAEVHSKLFEPDMVALGFPARTNTQADGEWFQEQRALAVRRLKSQRSRGHHDGLYLIGNSPVVLCELKRYDALESPADVAKAKKQLIGYALSEDFETPPPFLALYCGRPERTVFWRLRTLADATLADEQPYEELGQEIWEWKRVTGYHLKGQFAEEEVDSSRLLEILLHHLDRIEDDLRKDVAQAVQIAASKDPPGIVSPFGRFLLDHDEARRRMEELLQRKMAEIPKASEKAVVEEMVTQAALSYLNKVFFLNLCEERNLPGFYRILREFLPKTRAATSQSTAVVFLGLLRRKIRDATADWDATEEQAYRSLRNELTDDIREHVIDQNNWSELIRVAFDLAQEEFPLVYREDAYDYFRPTKETVAELVYDLSTKSFARLTNEHVGNIYQGLLSSRRRGADGRGGRQAQQSKLGAFYTPQGDVEYMVSKLNLTAESRVLDPCMGSGHFLEGLYETLRGLHDARGVEPADAHREIVENQVYGGDIDTFATSLAAIRMFLLDEHGTRAQPNLYVHDMLLHSPERPGDELFSFEVLETEGQPKAEAELVVSSDRDVDDLRPIDEVEFDAVVGNPPYGARKPEYKRPIYARLFGARPVDLKAGSIGTGDKDTYSMFFASAIERLREGGRLCLITNDSFRTLTTHAPLRRYMLDRCKIVEVLLTDTKHFDGVSFQFAGMAITTLEKCSDEGARKENTMRLVDYIRDPADFANPMPGLVTELRQDGYEALPETPFFVGVPNDIFVAARDSERVANVARGRQGLATADDKRFLASVGEKASGLDKVVDRTDLAEEISDSHRTQGIPPSEPHWVPFAKGEGFGEYWRDPGIAIDWSVESVKELRRRDRLPSGTPRKPRFQNHEHYFRQGITYSVVSSGRVSARLMPEGWVFGHKGSAVFVEDDDTLELFLLGYLNSALATYFMKKIVNTTATADIGYIEKLPYRKPTKEIESTVVDRVERITEALKADPDADVTELRAAIDEQIIDLFEVHGSRDEILRFYESIGKSAEGSEGDSTQTNE